MDPEPSASKVSKSELAASSLACTPSAGRALKNSALSTWLGEG